MNDKAKEGAEAQRKLFLSLLKTCAYRNAGVAEHSGERSVIMEYHCLRCRRDFQILDKVKNLTPIALCPLCEDTYCVCSSAARQK
jgi:DNA-directed RNA polymerase subunit RPC12/RpoP